jgi:hypothetical protein
MRRQILILSVVLSVAFAEDAPDAAKVTFSNGETAAGDFSFTPGRKLEIFDLNRKKRISVAAEEIARISVGVEEEKMESGWMFREEGLKDKIKLPFKYPLRQLFTDVTLLTGAVVHGHCNGTFYLEKDGDSKRYVLYTNQKGENGQTLEDIVYVREVAFPNRKAAGGKQNSLTAPPGTTLYDFERDMTLEEPFTSLLPGKYDVVVFPVKFPNPHKDLVYKVRYGLTGTKGTPELVKTLQDRIDPIEDFFTKKKVIDAVTVGKNVHALIEMTRAEASYDAGLRFARIEIWTFEPTQQSYDIKKRMFLKREKFSDKEPLPKFEYVWDDALKSVGENGVVK